MNWKLILALSFWLLLFSSIAQPLVMASDSELQETSASDTQLEFSPEQENQSLIISDPEAALDNHPELRELWDKQRYFFAAFQWIEKTLGEVETALAAPDNLDLDNLVDVVRLRAENFENKFFDLFQTLETMDGLPALVVENERARWVRIDGQIDNKAKAWGENLLSQSYQLVDKLRALQEDLSQSTINDVLAHIAAMRELIGMVPSGDTVVIRDLWFERSVAGSWRRTTWAKPKESVRVMIRLHNTDWFARGLTWLKRYWHGFFIGTWYIDLPGFGYTGDFELYRRTAPNPGYYKFSTKGRWEAWSCVFCWPTKVGEGTILKEERTIQIINTKPRSDRNPVNPLSNPWGTTFTYSTHITDDDGHRVKVTLHKDGTPYGSKWVSGSGTAIWTWTSTSADVGDHNYFFVAIDGYDTTRDPSSGAYFGPRVTRHTTSLSMSASTTEIRMGQSVTFSGQLRDTTANKSLGSKVVRLERRDPGSTTWINSGISYTTDSGNYSITFKPTETYYYRAKFGGDSLYYGSTSSSTLVVLPPDPPTANFTYSPAIPYAGQLVYFYNRSSDPDGTVVSWSWDFGDASTSTQRNPTHRYSSGGNYPVRLTVTDDDGLSDSITKTVPVFDFSLASSNVTFPRGYSASTTVTVTIQSDLTRNVGLSGRWVGTAPAGISASFRPTSGYPTFTSTLTFTAASDASVGRFTYRIIGSGGGMTKTVDITVTIVQISLSGAEDLEVPWSRTVGFFTLYADTGNRPPESVWVHIDDTSWEMKRYSWEGAPDDWVTGAWYNYIFWETTSGNIGAHTCYFEVLDAYGKTTTTDTFQVEVRKRESQITGQCVDYLEYPDSVPLQGFLQDLDFLGGIGSAEVKIKGRYATIEYGNLWYWEVEDTYTTRSSGYFGFLVPSYYPAGATGVYEIRFEGNNEYFGQSTGSHTLAWFNCWGGTSIGISFAEASAKADGDYTGYLSEDITSNYHKASVNEGGTLTISMTPGSDYDLYLYNPNEELVASSTRRGDDLEEDITYTATMSGYHYIEVRRVSGSGAYRLSISGTQEVTPPETPILHEIHYGGRWTNENSPFWYWSTYDPESGIAQYEVYCSWTDTTFYTSDENYHLTLADGPHYIKVRAQNGVGLWSDWSSEAWVYIDTVPPVSSVNKIEPYWHRESTFIITASASDELSGAENVTLWYRYSADNSVWGPWSEFDFDNEEPWSWEFDAPEGDGYYEFYTIATDKTGNIEAAPENADAQAGVDTVPPESSVDPIEPYWQNSGMVPFEVTTTASDNLSGAASVELFHRYSPDNIIFGSWVSYSADNEEPWSWTFDAPEGDGYYEFCTVATDVTFNTEPVPDQADLNLGVDTTPAISSVDPIEPYWQESTSFAVSVTALDVLSGVADVELYYQSSIDNVNWSEWKLFDINNVAPYEWSFTALDGYALYQFYSVATDVAGNVENAPDVADAACGVAIPATIDIDPDTLNLRSQGRWITAYIELPSGHDLASINFGTVLLEDTTSAEPHPTDIADHDNDGIPDLMIKFDRSAVQSLVSVGEVELAITGKWCTVLFKGSDTIRVIEPGREQRGNRPEVPPGQSDEHPSKQSETPPGQSGEHPSQGQGETGGGQGKTKNKDKGGD